MGIVVMEVVEGSIAAGCLSDHIVDNLLFLFREWLVGRKEWCKGERLSFVFVQRLLHPPSA